MYCRESLVFFLHKHDVIEMGLKQKGNILGVVQPTMHSTIGVYDIQPPITKTYALLPVVSLGYTHT